MAKLSVGVSDIRDVFADLYRRHVAGQRVEVAGTLEIVGASFTVDDATIFGATNRDYVRRELAWYRSQSLYVDDIPGETPAIWTSVASTIGRINSNYGYLLWSADNGMQFERVFEHLRREPEGRRAVAIYTRPTMHDEWNEDGMQDFTCTNAVSYLLRNGQLHVVVSMRSSDAVFGYKNDLAWQQYVQNSLVDELRADGVDAAAGPITWQAASLHLYSRHYYLLHHFVKTGETHIALDAYREKYGL